MNEDLILSVVAILSVIVLCLTRRDKLSNLSRAISNAQKHFEIRR